MPLTVKMSPENGGRLLLDGGSYNPCIPYQLGERVNVMVQPQGPFQFTGWRGDIPAGCEAEMPLRIEITDYPQEIIATFQENPRHAAELVFDSDFENGNGILRYYDRAARRLVIEPKQVNLADNIWWHFKIHNITPGEFLQLNLGHWPVAGDSNPVYSYDGIHWQRMSGTKSPYIQRFDAPSVEICRNIPYPYNRSVALVKQLAGSSLVKSQVLAISEAGRPVHMLRITDPQVKDQNKRIIWVMARLHAFESHSSYYAEGLAKWLAGGSPEAAEVLQNLIVYVVPIMDVDNVFLGGSGKEQLTWDNQRVDFNRQWGPISHWEAIRSAKRLLEELSKSNEIAGFFDLHNPWFPDLPHWHIPAQFGDQSRQFSEIWDAALASTGSGAKWLHKLNIRTEVGQGIEPTNDPNLLSSVLYAANTLFSGNPNSLFMTIETPHWTDGYDNFITIRSLYAYGEAMGRAFAKFFKG